MKTMGRFREVQSFRQPWLLALMLLPSLRFLFGIYRQIGLGIPFGDNPMSNQELLLAFGLFVLFFCWFFFLLRLETEVDETGILYRFRGIHLRQYRISWQEIESLEAVTYKPIREYGGWGIRYGFHGKAYSVSGNQGIRVKTRQGASILFGTRQPREWMDAVRQFRKG